MARSQRRIGVLLGYTNIIAKNIVNLLYTPMLLAFVGRGDYGVFETANSFAFSLSLLTFGFTASYIKFYTERKLNGDEQGVNVLNGMYLIIYAIICAIAILIGLTFSKNVGLFYSAKFTGEEVSLLSTLMAIMTFNIATTLLSTVFDSNIVAHERFVYQQSRQLFTSLAIPGLALLLLRLGLGVVGVAIVQLTVNLCLLILNARFAIKKLDMRFDISRFDWMLFKSIAVFSGWIFANQVCDLINQNVPNLVLGAACGAAIVAVFSVAVKVRTVFISLSVTLSNVFIPEVNRIVASGGNDDELTNVMSRVGRYQMSLLCWVYGAFVVLGKFFISKWAGKDFMDAYWMLVMMVGPLLIPLSQNVGIEIQKAKNMHRARSTVYLIVALLSVGFSIIMSPSLGYWATAIAYTGTITIGNVLFMNWYYQAKVGLDMVRYWKRNLPIILACVLAVASCLVGTHFLPVNNFLRFFIWGAIFTVLYGQLLLLLGFNRDERKELFSLVQRFSKK